MTMRLPAGEPEILTIDWLDHLSPTANANPRWDAHFTNGTVARTQSDASCAYGIGNPSFRGVPLAVWFSRAGRIVHLMRADKYEEVKPTRVIFRRWYRRCDGPGNVIALFPAISERRDGSLCSSYEHVGQHGAASLAGVIARTRPATEAEYAPLMRELQSPPYTYNLRVIKRSPH
jgi:hypothetical protein